MDQHGLLLVAGVQEGQQCSQHAGHSGMAFHQPDYLQRHIFAPQLYLQLLMQPLDVQRLPYVGNGDLGVDGVMAHARLNWDKGWMRVLE